MNPDNPTTGEWTAESVSRMLGFRPHLDFRAVAAAHNAAIVAEGDNWRKALSAASDLAKQTFEEKEKQLVAEQEKVATIEKDLAAGQVVAQRLLKVVEQLPDVKFNSPTFKATIEELQEACRCVDTEIIEKLVAERTEPIMQQLAAAVEALKEIREAGYTLRRQDGTNVIDAALAKIGGKP